nr:PLP-dependent aminotransferase family protein [uncultured Actinoplanes sp.]
MRPIELADRLGRWSCGRGPLPVLLAARIRRLIDDGDLPPGSPLPPDRALAAALAVGRSTIVTAYDLLTAEGRIVRRQGSGTRVAGGGAPQPRPTTDAPAFLHLMEPRDGVILLACAAPDAPPPEVAEAYTATLPGLGGMGYHPMGHPRLRSAVAARYTERGAPTTPDQILITTGAQQALSLLARAFVRPGDHIAVETPTYPGALEAFREEGAILDGLPVGLAGLTPGPGVAYVIGNFHNPTGTVLPDPDRRRLVRSGVLLIDDEVHTDLGFPGEMPGPPMTGDRVIGVGSLSKVVWGGLRVGWVRAPVPVITRLARLRAVHDLGGDVPAQLATAHLLPRLAPIARRGAVQRRARHDHLRAELARHLPGWSVPAVRGGQTLWVRLPRGDGGSFAQQALRHGVAVLPGSGLDAAGGSRDHLRIHFIAPPAELTEAVRRLAAAWRDYRPGRAAAPPAMAF